MDHKDTLVICCLLLLGTLTFLERGKEIVSWKVYMGVIQKDRIRTQRGKKIPQRRVQCSATDDFLLLHIRVTVCCLRLTF